MEWKILDCCERGQSLIRQAVLQTGQGMVFDNSMINAPARLVLLFAAVRLIQAEPFLPSWALTSYAEDLVILRR